MSRVVYKYPIANPRLQVVELPVNFKIVFAGVQDGVPCIWAEVGVDTPKMPFEVRILATGEPVPPWFDHVYSFQIDDYKTIWHVYISRKSVT